MLDPFVGPLVAFLVALLVGGLAIYVSASIVVDVQNYSYAVVTAVLGALAWGLTAWIPLVGPLIALVVWIAVIRWRYPGGWKNAALIGAIAWVTALVILYALDVALGLGVGAFGVPGA